MQPWEDNGFGIQEEEKEVSSDSESLERDSLAQLEAKMSAS